MLIDQPHRERFFAKVKRVGDCLEWTASRNADGYGLFAIHRKCYLAHRVSWAIKYGRWPDKLLMHSCDNPACVRPSHLSEGTNRENQQDKVAKGRQLRRDAHPSTKVSECERREIVEAARKGVSARELSVRLDVTDNRIYMIAREEGAHIRYSNAPTGRAPQLYTVGQECLTIAEIAARAGMTTAAIRAKMKRGLRGLALLQREK